MKLLTFSATDVGALQQGTEIKGIEVPAGDAWILLEDGKEIARGGALYLINRDRWEGSGPKPESTGLDRVFSILDCEDKEWFSHSDESVVRSVFERVFKKLPYGMGRFRMYEDQRVIREQFDDADKT